MQDKNLSTICCPASRHSQSNSAAKASGAGERFSIKVLFTVEKRAWMFSFEKHDFEVFCPSMRNPTFEGQESGPGMEMPQLFWATLK